MMKLGGGTNDDIGEYEENDGYSDPKSKYNFHRNDWKEGEFVKDDNRKDSVEESDDSSEHSENIVARSVEKTAAAVSGGSVKDKRGKKMKAGGITVGRVERGKKMAADGGSQSTRTSPRKRLFDTSKEKTVKRKK